YCSQQKMGSFVFVKLMSFCLVETFMLAFSLLSGIKISCTPVLFYLSHYLFVIRYSSSTIRYLLLIANVMEV
ncbi:MAG: hypothetical protein J6V70_08340, partial [Kiritimatiellae bacterium]|nr:hypothetical protein [Kiritimatiellia bacterium]